LTSGSNNISLDEKKDNQKHLNKKLNIFFWCLIIAAVMWLMIKLSGSYTHNLVFSVSYKGIQKNKILIPSSDTLLIASIQSSGYNIIYNRLLHKNFQIQLDLNQYRSRLSGRYFEIFIETQVLANKLQPFLRPGEKLVSIYPSSLNLKLEKAFSKKVPVKVNVDISYKKQYNVYKHIYLEPDSVVVTGSKKMIDAIKYVETEKREMNNLSENSFLLLKLINPVNSYTMRYSSDQVKMYIPVAQYTEEYVDIPLTFDSVPEDYQLIAYPDKVRCYFFVSVPDLSKISVDSFKAGFNEAELFHSKHNIAKVILKKVPSFANMQRVEPDNIEYLIRKK
jgi:hypothetical protein